MNAMRQYARVAVHPLMIYSFASLFNCTRGLGPQTEWQLLVQSVSDGCRLTVAACRRAHRGPTCVFLLLWFQIAIDSSTKFFFFAVLWLFAFYFELTYVTKAK